MTRELRELVRHRAKLVGMRSNCKAQIHAMLANCGIQVSMTDLFGLRAPSCCGFVAVHRYPVSVRSWGRCS